MQSIVNAGLNDVKQVQAALYFLQVVFTARGLAPASANALRVLVASDDEFATQQARGQDTFSQSLGASSELKIRQVRCSYAVTTM